jgi:hypothetical protein
VISKATSVTVITCPVSIGYMVQHKNLVRFPSLAMEVEFKTPNAEYSNTLIPARQRRATLIQLATITKAAMIVKPYYQQSESSSDSGQWLWHV